MTNQLKELKERARNADKSDLRHVIEDLCSLLIDRHNQIETLLTQSATSKEKSNPLPKRKKAQPKTLKTVVAP